jgi:hypothetical protein
MDDCAYPKLDSWDATGAAEYKITASTNAARMVPAPRCRDSAPMIVKTGLERVAKASLICNEEKLETGYFSRKIMPVIKYLSMRYKKTS